MKKCNKSSLSVRERPVEPAPPDCDVCIEKLMGCEQAQSGSFCTRFRTEEAADRGEGPAEKWSRGDDGADI